MWRHKRKICSWRQNYLGRKYKATIKCIKKGNAAVILAHVKKGEEIETATQIYSASFYVDENNNLTLITEEDAIFSINK